MTTKTETSTSKAETVPVKTIAKTEPKTAELSHRTPWRLFDEVRDEMEDFWRGAARNWPAFPRFQKRSGREGTRWMPTTDVYRSNGNLVVKADLPGLKKEDVEVKVENGFLIVQGERKEEKEEKEKEEKEKEYYRSECSYGSFYRRVPLPDEVDAAKISAKVHDGVLEVTVPLPPAETKEAKKITVY